MEDTTSKRIQNIRAIRAGKILQFATQILHQRSLTYELRVLRKGANYLRCGTQGQNDLLWVLVALSTKVER